VAEREVSPIGETSSGSSTNDSTSGLPDSERVRLEEPTERPSEVEASASSSHAEDVDEVNPSNSDWVVTDVRITFSKYRTTASLRTLLDIQDLIDPSIPDGVFSLHPCTLSDLVFHGRGTSSVDFFFMYAHVMKDSCVFIPFDAFCLDVLRTLNVAPTQLHMNGWAYIRAFQILCIALAITPTVPLFLHHYLTRPGRKVE